MGLRSIIQPSLEVRSPERQLEQGVSKQRVRLQSAPRQKCSCLSEANLPELKEVSRSALSLHFSCLISLAVFSLSELCLPCDLAFAAVVAELNQFRCLEPYPVLLVLFLHHYLLVQQVLLTPPVFLLPLLLHLKGVWANPKTHNA